MDLDAISLIDKPIPFFEIRNSFKDGCRDQ